MMGHVSVLRGDGAANYFLHDDGVDVAGFARALGRACDEGAPVCVAGTAFAFVALLDALEAEGRRFDAPPGSRVMETGGFKGRTRAVERDELYARTSDALGIAPGDVIAEYGMTELLSQYYDAPDSRGGGDRIKVAPPWLRTLVVDDRGARTAGRHDGLPAPRGSRQSFVGRRRRHGRSRLSRGRRDRAPRPKPRCADSRLLARRRRSLEFDPGDITQLTAARIVDAVADAAARWTDADFPPRVRVVRALVERMEYTEPVVDYALDALFGALDARTLRATIAGELGSLDALGDFVARPGRPDVAYRGVDRVAIVSSDTTIGVALPLACLRALRRVVRDRQGP